MARNRDCQAANYAKRGLITARRPAVMSADVVASVVARPAPERGDLYAATRWQEWLAGARLCT